MAARLRRATLLAAVLLTLAATTTWPQARQVPALAEGRLARIVADVEPFLRRWGYPALFGVIALDTTGVPTPAASIMVAGTIAADRHELRLDLVALVAVLAAVAGSQLGFAIGRYGGRRLLARLPVSPQRLATLEQTYQRWGPLVVIWAPLSEGLRQLNGIIAGTLGMAWWKFTAANLVGSLVFVALWVGGAWLVDEHLAVVLPVVRASAPWLIAAAVVGLAGLLLHLRQRTAASGRPSGLRRARRRG
jgi:membrane protein DedA with SNARE-associated domain